MSASVMPFLERLVRHFFADQCELIAAYFAYPMPFYAKDDLAVFTAPHALTEGLRAYRHATQTAGIVDLKPRIVAEGLPVRRYSSIWVEWDHIDGDGACVLTGQARYVLHDDPGDVDPKIEMVDYTRLAFPEITTHLPMAASA